VTITKILVVDDEPLMRSFLAESLRRMHYEVEIAADGKEALDILKKIEIDLVISDMKMPKLSGLDLVKEGKKLFPHLIFIVMTAFGTIENAVNAMQEGAFHYLLKPFTLDALEALIEKAKAHLALLQENSYLKREVSEKNSKHPFIAQSKQMKQLAKEAQKIAASNASVFIHGESGTGKEVMASYIHAHSSRNHSPYICVNCAAIADTLLESEFFGHEKGAFTGANQKRQGRFELAHMGTLLLDEVTEIPLSLQPKLLRVLQERLFERVGGNQSLSVDVRIISTSNRNLDQAILEKSFREDLYYRLNVIPLYLPPLRERKEDIIPLAIHYIHHFCKENKQKPKELSEESTRALFDYSWPGNIRQLANMIERICVLHPERQIVEPEMLDLFKTSPYAKA
jgi:two-component system response regulator AtoC